MATVKLWRANKMQNLKKDELSKCIYTKQLNPHNFLDIAFLD